MIAVVAAVAVVFASKFVWLTCLALFFEVVAMVPSMTPSSVLMKQMLHHSLLFV